MPETMRNPMPDPMPTTMPNGMPTAMPNSMPAACSPPLPPEEDTEKGTFVPLSVSSRATTQAAGEATKAMRAAGIADVNPNHPDLLAMLDQGMTISELVSASVTAISSRADNPFKYALKVARSEREKLAARGALPEAKKASHFALKAGHVNVLPDDLPDLDLEEGADHAVDTARSRG
jgi:hypothetical protein